MDLVLTKTLDGKEALTHHNSSLAWKEALESAEGKELLLASVMSSCLSGQAWQKEVSPEELFFFGSARGVSSTSGLVVLSLRA